MIDPQTTLRQVYGLTERQAERVANFFEGYYGEKMKNEKTRMTVTKGGSMSPTSPVMRIDVPRKPAKLITDKDQFFKSLGYHRHKQSYRGKGYYFIVGGYDLTKQQADDLWKAVEAQKKAHADMVVNVIDDFDLTASQKQMIRKQRERNQ